MAEVRPFRGIRYAASLDLDDLVSPPYDVLTAAEVDGLRAKSPYNAIHVDLPTRPGEAATPADYDRAGWEASVDRMIQNGAQLTPEERDAVVDFLAAGG